MAKEFHQTLKNPLIPLKAADEEFLPAISQCINMICMLHSSDKHIDKFKHYIKIGAELEDPFAMYKRSIELKYGFHEEEEDTEEAFELLKKKSDSSSYYSFKILR